MKIADKSGLSYQKVFTAATLWVVCALGSGSAHAADGSSSVPFLAAPTAPVAGIDEAGKAAPGSAIKKNVTAMEDKVAENAKGVVSHLDSSTEMATLDDINSAHQTIVRIETLIEVEKKLLELEKLRAEHNGVGHGSAALAGAIPASALTPPPAMANMAALTSGAHEENMMPRPVKNATSIVRITGSDGKYSAVFKVGSDTKTVRVGDQVSEGETVRWITPASVGVEERGVTRIVHIKNADTLFSAMR